MLRWPGRVTKKALDHMPWWYWAILGFFVLMTVISMIGQMSSRPEITRIRDAGEPVFPDCERGERWTERGGMRDAICWQGAQLKVDCQSHVVLCDHEEGDDKK